MGFGYPAWLWRMGALFAVLFACGTSLASNRNLDDQAIADAIEDQYRVDRAVDVNRIDVKVSDGIAELTGTMGSAAEDNAWEGGATSVRNKLEVN